MVASSILAKERAWTRFLRRRVASSPRRSFCNSSTARLRCGIPRTSARKSSDRIEMSGLSSPAAAKMSVTPSDATAREVICRTTWSISSSGRASPGARPASADWTAWKKPTSSRMRSASSCGTASANAWDSSRTARRKRSLPVVSWARGPVSRSPAAAPSARMCSCAAGNSPSRSAAVPVIHADRSKPWNRPRQISYLSIMTATASDRSSAVAPAPPLSV